MNMSDDMNAPCDNMDDNHNPSSEKIRTTRMHRTVLKDLIKTNARQEEQGPTFTVPNNTAPATKANGERDETEQFNAGELRRHMAQQTTTGNNHPLPHANTTGRFSITGRKYLSVAETNRNVNAAASAALKDTYELKEMMARGAEAVLYRATCGAFTYCAKSIRNNWTKLLGGNNVNGGEKLENVKYSTKLRHIKNEFAVAQKLNQNSDMPVVRIYALRKVTRFGVEIGYDLLMEYLDGHDLADKILTRILPLEDKVRILYQAAQALEYLHHRKIVHLDIKPSNFMLVTGKVKLIDFGVSVMSGYRANAITGTGGYLSPEQICKETIDEQTDLFAFGVAFSVFFGGRPLTQPQEQLMTRSAKQEAKYQMESLETPAARDLPALNDLPLVADIVKECTIPRRDRRTRSCAAFLMKLKAAAEQYNIVL